MTQGNLIIERDLYRELAAAHKLSSEGWRQLYYKSKESTKMYQDEEKEKDPQRERQVMWSRLLLVTVVSLLAVGLAASVSVSFIRAVQSVLAVLPR